MSESRRPITRITSSTDGERGLLPPGAADVPDSASTRAGGLLVDGALREDLRPRDDASGVGQGVGSPTVILCELADEEDAAVDDLCAYGTVEVPGE